jgi:phosphoglycerate dehydrogenase-like enzyme
MPQPSQLTIWTNYRFPADADAQFVRGIEGHRLIRSAVMQASNLVSGPADGALAEADVALGQPDPAALIAAPRVRWVHLTSAGYDRYDTAAVRGAMKERGGQITNSGSVYDEPCAQHALAMMMGLARQLPQSLDMQRGERAWPSDLRRIESFLLTGQTAVILSYGAIARRLIELLTPFRMKIYAVRRKVRGDEGAAATAVAEKDVASVLPLADHAINVLPGGEATRRFMDAGNFAMMKPGAIFYNIGRGGTVDQEALLAALESGRLRYAYLDVTEPEPLPAGHRLWAHPRCFITPHTAGGAADEFTRLAGHFLENLRQFERGEALVNRVV